MLSALIEAASEPRLGAHMLTRLATQLARALDVPVLSVRLLDHSGRWLVLKASVGLSELTQSRIRRIPVDSPIGRAIVGRRRRVVRAGTAAAGLHHWPPLLIRRFGSGAFVPIRSGQTVLGMLSVGYRHTTRPPASQIRFLDALGRQLGAALGVVRGREARRRARSETRFLGRITAALSANLELRAVLDMVTSAAVQLTRARGAVVLLQSSERAEFEVASTSPHGQRSHLIGLRLPADGSVLAQVVRTGRSACSRDAAADSRPSVRPLHQTMGARGLLVVPLRGAEGTIGTLAVSSGRPRLFSSRDRHILMQLAYQASIAIQNARLFDAVRSHRQLLRQLCSQQFSVLEGERKRIAHELHDEMGPALSAILINLRLFGEAPDRGGAVATKVAETERLLTGIIENVRELAYGLHPPMLEHLGLAESLKWMIETYFRGGHLMVDYRQQGEGVRLDPEIALAIYRSAQEALTNVVKHARARHVAVRLRVSPSLVTLRVQDDGCGFNPPRDGDRTLSLGLASMRERMEHLNGRMEIRSAPGKGTQLTVACPVEVRNARAAC
jgi:signal transduction histidine kinase